MEHNKNDNNKNSKNGVLIIISYGAAQGGEITNISITGVLWAE